MPDSTVAKINELNGMPAMLSEFEGKFISDNITRIVEHGEAVTFSEKQTALVDSVFKERVIDNRAPKAKG
jgi:hypothetical protein